MKHNENRDFTLRHTRLYLILYFGIVQAVLPILLSLVYALFSKSTSSSAGLPDSYLLIMYVIGLALFVGYSFDVLVDQFKRFLKDFKKNLLIVLKLTAVLLVVSIAMNYVVSMITGLDTSANQNSIAVAAQASPFFVFFSGVIFAPICEELLFRGGLYFPLRNTRMGETMAIAISSVVFGILHVLPVLMSSWSLGELLYLIPYSFMGLMFTIAAKRTDNIFGSILLHFINNLIAIGALLVAIG